MVNSLVVNFLLSYQKLEDHSSISNAINFLQISTHSTRVPVFLSLYQARKSDQIIN